jgi:hypothetical protein
MLGNIIRSVTRQKRIKFSQDQKFELKISFELDCQISLEALPKFGINFIHFAWAKVNEMKPRVNIMLKKALSPTNYPN